MSPVGCPRFRLLPLTAPCCDQKPTSPPRAPISLALAPSPKRVTSRVGSERVTSQCWRVPRHSPHSGRWFDACFSGLWPWWYEGGVRMLGPQAPPGTHTARPQPLSRPAHPCPCAVSVSPGRRPSARWRETWSDPQEAVPSPLFRELFLFFQARKTLGMTATPFQDPVTQNRTVGGHLEQDSLPRPPRPPGSQLQGQAGRLGASVQTFPSLCFFICGQALVTPASPWTSDWPRPQGPGSLRTPAPLELATSCKEVGFPSGKAGGQPQE